MYNKAKPDRLCEVNSIAYRQSIHFAYISELRSKFVPLPAEAGKINRFVKEEKNMKKRLLSMLMALCLMATMIPAAFAADTDQPDTITLPNGEVREIPTVEFPDAPETLAETNSNEVEIIDSIEKFDGITPEEWRSGKTFKITTDLNLAESTKTVAEWGGFIPYFYGKMIGEKADGTTPVISGIPNNCGLIYGIVGGTIENLTFHHVVDNTTDEKGSASFITFMPATMDGANHHLTMKDVTVTGNISLTGADQSNYAPFLYAAPRGGLTMERCVNDAAITGSIYGSVFHGYYPLFYGVGAPYTFKDCVNNGNVTMQYAGMFFGNSSSVEGTVGSKQLYLTIEGCKNTGVIRGTSGAKYFAAPVAEFGSGMQAVEDMIKPLEPNEVRDETQSPYTIKPVEVADNGALCEENALVGFEAVLNGNEVTVTRPENEAEVDYYRISVSAYTYLWDNTNKIFDGSTDRYTVSQNIIKDASLGNPTFVPDLKVYGFADTGVGEWEDFSGDYDVYKYGDICYYWVPNTPLGSGFTRYVSNKTNEDGAPAAGGTKAAEIVTVAAYKNDGTMIDIVNVPLKQTNK